jgi:hypothetical protein
MLSPGGGHAVNIYTPHGQFSTIYTLKSNMLATTSILALLYGLQASAQSFTETSFVESTFAVFPTGIATGNSQIESGFPLACASGCYPVAQYY